MSWCFCNLGLNALGSLPASHPEPGFWNEAQHLPVPSYFWLVKKEIKGKQPREF